MSTAATGWPYTWAGLHVTLQEAAPQHAALVRGGQVPNPQQDSSTKAQRRPQLLLSTLLAWSIRWTARASPLLTLHSLSSCWALRHQTCPTCSGDSKVGGNDELLRCCASLSKPAVFGC